MTRAEEHTKALYDTLGSAEYRKELESAQFRTRQIQIFKIASLVDHVFDRL